MGDQRLQSTQEWVGEILRRQKPFGESARHERKKRNASRSLSKTPQHPLSTRFWITRGNSKGISEMFEKRQAHARRPLNASHAKPLKAPAAAPPTIPMPPPYLGLPRVRRTAKSRRAPKKLTFPVRGQWKDYERISEQRRIDRRHRFASQEHQIPQRRRRSRGRVELTGFTSHVRSL